MLAAQSKLSGGQSVLRQIPVAPQWDKLVRVSALDYIFPASSLHYARVLITTADPSPFVVLQLLGVHVLSHAADFSDGQSAPCWGGDFSRASVSRMIRSKSISTGLMLMFACFRSFVPRDRLRKTRRGRVLLVTRAAETWSRSGTLR